MIWNIPIIIWYTYELDFGCNRLENKQIYILKGGIEMSNDVLFAVRDKIATITFNRANVGNAFSKDSYQLIKDYVEQCYDDKNVGAIVLTGKGKHFSAGGDINRFKKLIETGEYLQQENISRAGSMAATVRKCPKPTIAMINGAAAGAGCSIALACDFRIVTHQSKLVMAFIKMGLSGDTGGLYYLQKLVGIAKTTELMMLGNIVGGEEAYRIGLATKLVDNESLSEETYKLAAVLANSPLVAIRKQKQLIEDFFFNDLDAYTLKEVEYMVECSRTKDFEEAVDAFLEKRTPNFRGE